MIQTYNDEDSQEDINVQKEKENRWNYWPFYLYL
jgi:hypothetical protein